MVRAAAANESPEWKIAPYMWLDATAIEAVWREIRLKLQQQISCNKICVLSGELGRLQGSVSKIAPALMEQHIQTAWGENGIKEWRCLHLQPNVQLMLTQWPHDGATVQVAPERQPRPSCDGQRCHVLHGFGRA